MKEEETEYVLKIQNPTREITVGITGKYTSLRDSYASIIKALEHAGTHNSVKINLKWIETTDLEEGQVAEALKDVDGIIVPGAFGSRGAEGKINCIKYARENKMPYLGLCYGFQMALIEYARNVCGFSGANTTEIEKSCLHPVIDLLPEQQRIEELGGNMRLGGYDIEIKQGTFASELYNGFIPRERFRHRWECNPSYISRFEDKGLIFSGKAPGREIMQILELPRDVHPFFIGTQAHPEFRSRPLKPSPFYMGFVKAILSGSERHPQTLNNSPSPQSNNEYQENL